MLRPWKKNSEFTPGKLHTTGRWTVPFWGISDLCSGLFFVVSSRIPRSALVQKNFNPSRVEQPPPHTTRLRRFLSLKPPRHGWDNVWQRTRCVFFRVGWCFGWCLREFFWGGQHFLGFVQGSFFTDSTMANHHYATIRENMFGFFPNTQQANLSFEGTRDRCFRKRKPFINWWFPNIEMNMMSGKFSFLNIWDFTTWNRWMHDV